MPRGMYDRAAAKASPTSDGSLSKRLERISKELEDIAEQVKKTEELEVAVKRIFTDGSH